MIGRLFAAWLLVAAPGLARGQSASAIESSTARLTGVVVYADPDWQRAYVLTEGGRIVAAPAAAGVALRHRIAIESVREARDLGNAMLPEAAPLDLTRATVPQWVRVEGWVRAVVPAEETRTFLRVSTSGLLIDVHLPRSRGQAAGTPYDAGARLSLRGVFEPARDAWSRPRLWVADWSEAVLLSPPAPWDGLRTVTVDEVRSRALSGAAEEVRLVGHVAARRSATWFTVEADGGSIEAELPRPDVVTEGIPIEVRGFPGRRRGEVGLEDTRWRTSGTESFNVSRREPGLPVLTTAAAIRALPRAEAERGYPVRLEGAVTYAAAVHSHLFVQDDTGGVFVNVLQWPAAASSGDRVRVVGFTAPGGLAPLVTDPVITRIGSAPLPRADRISTSRLAAAFDDCRRVEATGYVRRVARRDGETEITLAIEGLRVPVYLPLELADDALPPLDARVRVAGVCGTAFNWRKLLDHVELFVAREGDLVVEERPPEPFSLPISPARDLLRSTPDARWNRLVRTHGVVLHRRDGQPLYVRTQAGSVVADSVRAEPLEPGDEVDVVGFPAPGANAPRLEDATFRRVAAGPPPQPAFTGDGALLAGRYDTELARVTAPLIEVVQRDSGTTLLLRAAGSIVEAHGSGDFEAVPADRSTLEVTGIVLPHQRQTGADPAVDLLLRSPADVRVVARPPWLTPRRAAQATAALGLAAALALAWVVTLRRRVRARTSELAAAERRYRLLADNASDVIVTTDESLRLTYVSPSVMRDSGYTAEEVLALPLERVLAPESWKGLRESLAHAGSIAGDEPVELGVEMLRKDGTRVFMHVRARALRDDAGRLTGYCAAARDVTARRQAQQEMARLAAAIEQSADAIVLTDPAGTILYVNPAFERVTGYAAAEVLGGTPALLKSGAHDRAFYDAMWKTLHEGRTWEGRFTNRRKDGRLFLEDASISPVRERAEGRLIGYVAVKRDVTRQVQLEGQLAQARKMEAIGRLAAGVAHDFNNVLAIILSLSDLALQRGDANERTAKCVQGIREAALRAGGLTRQVLTFSRQAPGALEPLDPRPVVAEAAGMLRHLMPSGVRVRTRLESTARVRGDATQLHQVVLNLGTNAGLAMAGRGGEVEVSLEDAHADAAFAESHEPMPPGPCLRLAVRDEGCGMSAETLSRVFEPFFTTRAPREGTGMGLAVVHGIVHNHGGAIAVDSEPGHGSTFSVYLPALPPTAAPDAGGAGRASPA